MTGTIPEDKKMELDHLTVYKGERVKKSEYRLSGLPTGTDIRGLAKTLLEYPDFIHVNRREDVISVHEGYIWLERGLSVSELEKLAREISLHTFKARVEKDANDRRGHILSE